MFANFTEETATDSAGVLTLAGVTTGMIPFSASFADGDLVSYVAEDATNKVAGIGTYVSATNSITRNDTWNYNGTVVDKNPATNIALSGTVTVRCANSRETEADNASFTLTEMPSASASDVMPDNWIQCDDWSRSMGAIGAVLYTPVYYASPVEFNSLRVKIPTASATDVMQVGICRCGLDGLPSSVIEIVTVDVTSTGTKDILLSQSYRIPGGRYFVFMTQKDLTSGTWTVKNLTHGMRSGSFVDRGGTNGPLRAFAAATDGIITVPLVKPTEATDPLRSPMVIPRYTV